MGQDGRVGLRSWMEIDKREEEHVGSEQERMDGKVLNLGSSKTREGPGKQERGREGDCGEHSSGGSQWPGKSPS